ncbi:MAG: sulfotransferase [Micrococcales bacterium]|nr:sulfotransferase [Micrococcales bacterium]
MSLRQHIPARLHEASRTAYVRLGTATAGARLAPSFIMVGASRCGTTSLFRALNAHPAVVRPTVNKGVRYFDLNPTKSWAWYLGHFPLRRTAQARAQGYGPPMAFEASGYYVVHPYAVPRIATALPDVKLVAMFRDPVERAYSAWKHETARGFEWEPFERALELEDARMLGEVERMSRNPDYESFCHRHQSHRLRGQYADQLERMWAHLPRDQVHVLQSEAFFAEPEHEFNRLLDFLGLPRFLPDAFDRHNARPSSPMADSVRRRLEDHYAPYNERLEKMLGEQLRWG